MRSEQPRHSKKALLVGLTLFGLLAFLLRFAPEHIAGCYDVEFRHRLSKLTQRVQPGQSYQLLLGTSRIAYGVRPSAMGVVQSPYFNFGLPARGSVESCLVLERLLQLGYRPSRLIIEFWWPLFAPDRDTRDWGPILSLAERRQLAKWRAKPQPSAWEGWQGDLDWPIRLLCPGLEPAYDTLRVDCDNWGYTLEDRQVIGAEAQEAARRARVSHLKNLPQLGQDPLYGRALSQLIATAKRENIPIVGLRGPQSDDYSSGYTPQQKSQIDQFYRNWASQFEGWIDAQTWGENEDFFDGVHLNRDSVDRFSAWLGERLKTENR
jgi:hypothetical protein